MNYLKERSTKVKKMSLCLYLPKSGPDRASHWFPGLCCFWNPVLTLALRHSLQQWDGSSTHIHSTLQLHDFSSPSPSDYPPYSILGSHSGATPLPSHQVRQLHFQNCGLRVFLSVPTVTYLPPSVSGSLYWALQFVLSVTSILCSQKLICYFLLLSS